MLGDPSAIVSSSRWQIESLERRFLFSAPLFDIVDLGAGVVPVGINDAGQVIASQKVRHESWARAVLWTRVGGMAEPLAALTDAQRIIFSDITEDGTIVGSLSNGGGDEPLRPFLLKDAELIELPTPAGWPEARAIGASDSGDVLVMAGDHHTPTAPQRVPFRTTVGRFAVFRGASFQRQGLGDAMGIGGAGMIAGEFDIDEPGDDGLVYAQAISPRGRLAAGWDEDDRVLRLIVDGGKLSEWSVERSHPLARAPVDIRVFGVSDSGAIVGAMQYRQLLHTDFGKNVFNVDRAFLLRSHRVHDLTSLIDPASGWDLRQATAVNRHGQIVGVGDVQGVQHGFLLIPRAALPFDPPVSSYDAFISLLATEDDGEQLPERSTGDDGEQVTKQPANEDGGPSPEQPRHLDDMVVLVAQYEEEAGFTEPRGARGGPISELEEEWDLLMRRSGNMW